MPYIWEATRGLFFFGCWVDSRFMVRWFVVLILRCCTEAVSLPPPTGKIWETASRITNEWELRYPWVGNHVPSKAGIRSRYQWTTGLRLVFLVFLHQVICSLGSLRSESTSKFFLKLGSRTRWLTLYQPSSKSHPIFHRWEGSKKFANMLLLFLLQPSLLLSLPVFVAITDISTWILNELLCSYLPQFICWANVCLVIPRVDVFNPALDSIVTKARIVSHFNYRNETPLRHL